MLCVVGSAMCCGWRAVLPAVTRGGMVERGGPVLACRRLLWSLHHVHVAGGRGRMVGERVWRYAGSWRACACVLRVARGATG